MTAEAFDELYDYRPERVERLLAVRLADAKEPDTLESRVVLYVLTSDGRHSFGMTPELAEQLAVELVTWSQHARQQS
jgi:hypothetical protein